LQLCSFELELTTVPFGNFTFPPITLTLPPRMPPGLDASAINKILLPLAVGIALLFAAARAGSWALRAGEGMPTPRVVMGWLPIIAATAAAVHLGRMDLALAIIFGTSVAILSILVGAVALVAPESDPPPGVRRFWAFVLPVALLTFLAGMAGRLSIIHAGAFFLEGVVVLLAWPEMSSESAPVATEKNAKSDENPMPLLTFVILLACGGAYAAAAGTMASANTMPMAEGDVLIALLSPILILPLSIGVVPLAQHQRAWVAIGAGVRVVLLNLCLLLPALIVWQHQFAGGNPLSFPMITWRVDNVILILLSLVLIPVSMGRWRLGRAEGLTLVLFYLVFIIMELAAGRQS
jgi:Ca2+/Na+ antiporter